MANGTTTTATAAITTTSAAAATNPCQNQPCYNGGVCNLLANGGYSCTCASNILFFFYRGQLVLILQPQIILFILRRKAPHEHSI